MRPTVSAVKGAIALHFEDQPIIAAVRGKEELYRACQSPCNIIFLLCCSVLSLPSCIEHAHKNEKKLFLHIDLAEGIGKDAAGVAYVASLGIDGIITTRVNITRYAKECGITCVQRFFMVDSHSVSTALESVRAAHPDMIEIMPALALKTVKHLSSMLSIPVIAGGLIEEKEEIFAALSAGASAVSTGKESLWSV